MSIIFRARICTRHTSACILLGNRHLLGNLALYSAIGILLPASRHCTRQSAFYSEFFETENTQTNKQIMTHTHAHTHNEEKMKTAD